MKIIDILNKKANGTLEDGFKFKYGNEVYIYNKQDDKIKTDYENTLGGERCLDEDLNDEIEVIEENKEIEELNDTCSDVENMLNTDIDYYNNLTRNKINELVRAVNKLTKETGVK